MYVYIGEVVVVKGDNSQKVFSCRFDLRRSEPKNCPSTFQFGIFLSTIRRFVRAILVVELLMPKNLQMSAKFELSIWRIVFQVIRLEIWRTWKQLQRFFSLYNIWVSQHTYHTTLAKTEIIYPKNVGAVSSNGFHIRWIFGTQDNWKNENPASRFGATS